MSSRSVICEANKQCYVNDEMSFVSLLHCSVNYLCVWNCGYNGQACNFMQMLFVIVGVHYPSTTSLISRKVADSEKSLSYGIATLGGQVG